MAAVDHITLLANYEPDAQWSMLNFDRFLAEQLRGKGVNVDVLRPPPRIGAKAGKWIRYIDKYIFFQPALRRAAKAASASRSLLHICDHSNALYLHTARPPRHIVTCHDLIAVRIAKGHRTFTKFWVIATDPRAHRADVRQAARNGDGIDHGLHRLRGWRELGR